MDLIFPHHENEIAQSEGFSGKRPFVGHWVHNAMMQLGDEKMSKSLGNIISLREGLDRYGADGLRLFILGGHYRSPLTYSEESLVAAARGAERLRIAAGAALPGARATSTPRRRAIASGAPWTTTWARRRRWRLLFDLAHAINRAAAAGRPAGTALALLRELGGVLGLRFEARRHDAQAAPFIDLLVDVRRRLRAAKQYALADQIRDDLRERGVVVEDGRDGATWRSATPTLLAPSVAPGAPYAAPGAPYAAARAPCAAPGPPAEPPPATKAAGKAADTLRF